MTSQRTLRSNASVKRSIIAVSQSDHEDRACNDSSLLDGPTAATAIRPIVTKRKKLSRKPEESSASVVAQKTRVQTPELSQKTLSKKTQDGSQAPSHTPNDNNDVSFDRPAQPHTTNAPLVTPRGSRFVASSKGALDASPSRIGIPRPTMTTSHILDDACAHLIKMEPMLQPLIEKHYCRIFCLEGLAEECDPFRHLCSSIMAQQVSGAAASSIKRKFVRLFHKSLDEEKVEDNNVFPTPAQVAACNVAFLRQAGLSERKAEYIQGLAQKFASGELSAAMLINASDQQVLEKLTAVRGLGKWSVEMFACFGLKRMDILSTGDLGVQRGMAAFMGKDVKKLKAKGGGKWKYMSEHEMLKYSEKFSPYRSVFMWYMWRVENVDVNVVEGARSIG